ncbi:hypothetical protein [Silvibacterium bohemicum]|uniref:hypothetical protein n=1 Tax=Silvibacterium bohemicum TaxID=1577686 RepID=UPI001E3F054A|nr:hypothetical protein [Silvibacterium bohemicum]
MLLATFVAGHFFWHAFRGPRSIAYIFMLSYLLPNVYSGLKIYTTDDTRIDERDNVIKGRGRNAGYLLMTFGIWFILIDQEGRGFPLATGTVLVLVWLGSRILTSSVQLRIYAGHEAWWPDNLVAAFNRRRNPESIRASMESLRAKRERP